jgi:uncharacterized protein (DUF934 family)
MREIIKDKAVVSDDWSVFKLPEGITPDAAEVPAGKTIVPLQVWLLQRPSLLARLQQQHDLAVWFESDEEAQALTDDVGLFDLLAVNFPKFSDGRGYSIGYTLRARFDFKGELRAIGDVLRDQLFYMQRVGFNAFATREDRSVHDALKGLSDFSESYQTAWDEKNPLFRSVERNGANV